MSGELRPVPAGHVAAVVTYLEMHRRPERLAAPVSTLRLEQRVQIAPDHYRALFRNVGGRWLWFSRLAMSDAELRGSIGEVHVVVDPDGAEVGMIELDFGEKGECLIRFLGLVPELAGKGHGRWLFAHVLDLAWRKDVQRVRVNTCTLDHPAALPSYLKAGFTAVGRAFESFPDPRLGGFLASGIAPQIPVIPG